MSDVKHISGEAGGYLVGRRHSNGGIKAMNKSTGQPLEMEGGEVVITRDAVSDTEKRSFNGKMMTNREILSAINQSGGGVAFEEGGEVPESMHFDTDSEFEYGGATMCGCDIAQQMSKSYSTDKFEEGGEIIELSSEIAFRKTDNFLLAKDPNGNYVELGNIINSSLWASNGFEERFIKGQTKEDLQKIAEVMGSETPSFISNALQSAVAPPLEFVNAYKFEFSVRFRGYMSDTEKTEFLRNGLLGLVSTLEKNGAFVTPRGLDNEVEIVFETEKFWFTQSPSFKQTKVELSITYSLLNLSGLGYFGLLENIITNLVLNKINNLPQEEIKSWSEAFLDAHKVYFTGLQNYAEIENQINGQITNFRPFLKLNNFTDFERLSKFIKKEGIYKFSLKDRRANLQTSLGSGNSSIEMSQEFSLKNNLPIYPKDFTKWSWWKNDFLDKANISQRVELQNSEYWEFKYKNLDYKPYECDLVYWNPSRVTKKMVQTIEQSLRDSVRDKSSVSKFLINNKEISRSFYSLNATQFDYSYKIYSKDVDFYFSAEIGSDTFRAYSEVYAFKFFFNTETKDTYSFYEYGGPVVIEHDAEEYKKKKQEQEESIKQEKQKQKEEAKKAEAEKKAAEEALKNRGYQVRDQDNDFLQLFLKADDINDKGYQILKNEKELQASLKLLALTKGLALSPLKRKLLVKIRQLTENAVNFDSYLGAEESGVSTEQKLVTPLGLMTYYYAQARQSPISKMGEPCGYPTPSGEPSELDIQAYFAVRTLYFKKWFGDWEEAYESNDYSNCSTLINAKTGEPRVMYHGVRKFIKGLQTGAMGSGVLRPYGEFKAPKFPATYFGDSLDYVEFYAGQAKGMPKPTEDYEGFIYSVFINMRNPIRLEGLGMEATYKDILAYIAIKYGLILEPSKNITEKYPSGKLKVWNFIRNDINLMTILKKFGYDGIIQYGDVPEFKNGVASGSKVALEYLVFNPTQVKSAVVKNSFYARFFNDIRFKKGGYVCL